jgi:GNAT superfamily N-acetyltransferase
MNYRIAIRSDLPALAALRWAFRAEAGETPYETQADFTRRFVTMVADGIETGTWTYWVAVNDGEVIAQSAIAIVDSIPRPARATDRWGYLTDVYVAPAFRNAGVGHVLLAHVRSWAVARDLEFLLVWPSERSFSFYRRAGFDTTGSTLQLTLRSYDGSHDSLAIEPSADEGRNG